MNVIQLCVSHAKVGVTVSVALLLLNAASLATSHAQDETPKTKIVAAPVKVMSFNIRYGLGKDGENHWDKRAYLVEDTIKSFDPDLLGIQEALRFQADFLQEALPEYGFHGVGRADGVEKGEYVPVMYKKDRFQHVDSGHFWLSETPKTAGSKSWDSSFSRMVSWVQLRDKSENGSNIIFLNTHFDHRGQTARLESARLIRKYLEDKMDKGIPFIVTGDFNTTEDGQPYQELVSGINGNKIEITDSFRQAHSQRNPNEASFGRWVGERTGSRIDWILHSQEFTTLQSIINYTNERGRYPSDHYPVQSILRINN